MGRRRLKAREKSSGGQDDSSITSQITAAKVGGISLIVDKLISFMDFHSLKTSRLVSKYWREATEKELNLRDESRLTIKLDDSDPLFKKLNKNKATPFPCYDFVIDGLQGKKPKHKRLSLMEIEDTFIPIIGPSIKSLTLKGIRIDTPARKSALRSLLNEDAPNLENLSIDGFLAASEWNSYSEFHLPKLKYLKFIPDFEFLHHWITPQTLGYKIILGSPNLQQIEDLFTRGVSPQFWSQHIHLIKEYNLNQAMVKPKDLRKLADALPKLEYLSVVQEFSSTATNAYQTELLKILNSSQFSLTTLELANLNMNWLVNSGFVFENLETLILHLDNGQRNLDTIFNEEYLRKNHRGKDLQNKFPKLKHVSLNWALEDEKNEWEKYHPLKKSFINNLGTVETLTIGGIFWNNDESSPVNWDFPRSTLKRLQELFPNVTTINLGLRDGLDELLPTVFELWPEIETLKFSLYFDSPMEKGSLDKAFSKLSSLTELKNLHIEFVDSFYYAADEDDYKWIIPFSQKKWENTLRKLRMKIYYDTDYTKESGLNELLQPFASFVEFHHM